MKKIAWRQAQYIAGMPPYRFNPGDVIETDDENADRLVRLGIADKAPANAKTVLDRRRAVMDERNAITNAQAAEARGRQRAELQAEMARLDREDSEMGGYDSGVMPTDVDQGHYGDMIGRGDPPSEPEGVAAFPAGRGRRRGGHADDASEK